MSALIFAAWIAAAVGRLAAALRRLADAVAPLTVEAPAPRTAVCDWHRAKRSAPAPASECCKCSMCGAPDADTGGICDACDERIDKLVGLWRDDLPAPAPAPAPIAPEARRPAPEPSLPELYRAAAGDARGFARGELEENAARASLLACARRDPDTAEALLFYVEQLGHYTPARLEAVAANLDRCAELAEAPAPAAVASRATPVERYRAAVTQPAAAELHYVRSYREALCGAAYEGSRCTGDPQVWHAEPPSTRCETCAAELRRADPHRFDTRLPGIAGTSSDADELLSREPPFAGRGGSL